ncbi:beta-lactamase family protein [Pyrenochaeta sp. MPI-SDFR-AT-0127]|nr:beta-lactamase family protein [Pyrenochaeta sp. MPI-SDFR-AT-0127]
MAPSISTEAIISLKEFMSNATTSSGDRLALPGAVLHIVDTHNNTLFSHGSGSPKPPTADSIGIIQSLTKLVGAIAYLQLVERGLATLDDPSTIATHLPELAAKKVLIGYTIQDNGSKEWQLEDRVGNITPRMLLNHTYGGGHTYFNTLLLEYFQDLGIWNETNEAADTYGTILAAPLLFQPNTKTNYGQGLDWIAVLIERLTQQDLASYLQEHIFDPLDLKSIGFEAPLGGSVTSLPINKGKFRPRKIRTGDGGFVEIDAQEPVTVERKDAFPNGKYHMGKLGTGLVSSASDYAHLLTILLPENNGVDPITGHRLLTPASVEEITKPQLPEHIRNDSRNVPASGASPIILPGVLDAPNRDPEGSFGLACGVQGKERVLGTGKTGRSQGTVYWYGAANTEYWVDKKKGIVVFVNGNYYPWNEEVWTSFVAGVEERIYEGLH